ncbi:MAG: SDR family oxidoreductase [Pseudomonadota bacterium]
MTELQGRVALITGASRGIGAVAARDLSDHGVSVVLVARTGDQIERAAKDISERGGRAEAVIADVSRFHEMEKAVVRAVSSFGALDILVNNAGVIDPIARIDESDPEAWSNVVDINLKGVYFAVRAALPHMLKQGSGVIINLSSGAATGALEGWSHYCATKAAVLSLTKCLHKEYAGHGIRTVGLSPGTVATDMQVVIKASGVNPVSQLNPAVHIPPEWVGKAISFLATKAAREFDGGDFSLKTEEGRRRVGLE